MAYRRSVGWPLATSPSPYHSIPSPYDTTRQPQQWREFSSLPSNRSPECMDWLDASPESRYSPPAEQSSGYRWQGGCMPASLGASNCFAGGTVKGRRGKASPSSRFSMLNISEALRGGPAPPFCHAGTSSSYIRLPSFHTYATHATPFGSTRSVSDGTRRRLPLANEESESSRGTVRWTDDSTEDLSHRLGDRSCDMSVDDTVNASLTERCTPSPVSDSGGRGEGQGEGRGEGRRLCNDTTKGGTWATGWSNLRRWVVMLLCACLLVGFVAAALLHQRGRHVGCCSHHLDLVALDADLREKVFGQDLAVSTVLSALHGFLVHGPSARPLPVHGPLIGHGPLPLHGPLTGHGPLLVLSLHGWTGVGKNHVAGLVAARLPRCAVHRVIVPLHLAHASVEDSQGVRAWVTDRLTQGCGKSQGWEGLQLVIVDEVDKAGEGVVEGLLSAVADTAAMLSGWSTSEELRWSEDEVKVIDEMSAESAAGSDTDDAMDLSDVASRPGSGVTGLVDATSLTCASAVAGAAGGGRVLVLLLSNAGGSALNALTATMLEGGGRREDITHTDLVSTLRGALHGPPWAEPHLDQAPTEQGSPRARRPLALLSLVDTLVPFLPLERHHVALCVRAALRARGVSEVEGHLIDNVLDRLAYFPPERPLFSTAGCRRVSTLLDLLMD